MVLLQVFGIKLFVKTLNVPIHYLYTILVVLSLVGSYAVRQNFFDVLLTLGFGIFGYIFDKAKFPMAPIVLGLVLGSMFEGEVRRTLRIGGGSFGILLQKPIALFFIVIALGIIASSAYKAMKGSKNA